MRYVGRTLLLSLFVAAQGCTVNLPGNLLGTLVRAGGTPVGVAGSPTPSARPSATPASIAPPPDCHGTFTRYDIDRSGGWDLKEFLAFQAAHPAPPACPVPSAAPPTPRPSVVPLPLPSRLAPASPVPPVATPRPLPSPSPVVRPSASPAVAPTPTPQPSPSPLAYRLDGAVPQVPPILNADPSFPIGAPPPCGPDPQVIFRLMDTNQDGQLDDGEACALLDGGPPPSPTPDPGPTDGDGGLVWHAPTGPVTPGGPRPGPIAID